MIFLAEIGQSRHVCNDARTFHLLELQKESQNLRILGTTPNLAEGFFFLLSSSLFPVIPSTENYQAKLNRAQSTFKTCKKHFQNTLC